MLQNFKNCLLKNKAVYRSQQRFKSYIHDVYTEEVNKIVLSSNDDKRLQTFDRIITYPYRTNTFEVCESEMLTLKDLFFEKLWWNSAITININDKLWYYVNENKIRHNKNWSYIPDHPYRILIIGGSGSGKTNSLLNLIEN